MFENRSKNDSRTRVENDKSRPADAKHVEEPRPRPLDLTELAKVVGGTQAPKGGWSAR